MGKNKKGLLALISLIIASTIYCMYALVFGEEMLSHNVWYSFLFWVVFVSLIIGFLWFSAVVERANRKNKLLKDCPYCEGTVKIAK